MKTTISLLRPFKTAPAALKPRIPPFALVCYLDQHSRCPTLTSIVRRRVPHTSIVQSKQRSSRDWRTTANRFPSLTKVSRSRTAERVVLVGAIEQVWAVDSVSREGSVRCVRLARRYLVRPELATRKRNASDGLIAIEQCNSPFCLKKIRRSLNICKSERHPLVFSTRFKGMQFSREQ